MTKYTANLRKGANIRFGLSIVILALIVIFVAVPQYQQFIETRSGISRADQEIRLAESDLETKRDEYRILKAQYNQRAETDQKAILSILPQDAAITDIVRELEKKANELSQDGSFAIETVNFGKSKSDKEVDYLTLPIKINASGSKANIIAFLRYLEKSGSIASDSGQASRLLDVENVTLQAKDRGDKTDLTQDITVDLSVNAYNLPSPEEIAAAKEA